MELQKYKLGELLDVKRGTSLAGEFYATDGKYVRLTCGNFDYVNNSFKENTSKADIYYVGNVREEFIMQKGDIITPLTEQAIGLLGSTAIIPESGKYIQSQDVAKIICNEEILYPMYAFYLISSASVKAQLSAAAQQTKIRHTSPDKIKDCVVWIPDIKTQKKVASVLSNLDKKIALNKQINANLESLARQLYDYWFVQFDYPNSKGKPYKSSGGEMVYNEQLKREIPKGWEVSFVKEHIVPIERGISYSSEEISLPEGKPMINLACYSKQGDYRTGEMKFFSGNIKDEDNAYPYEMFIACTDMTQDADVIGRPILATEEYDSYVFSMDLAKITPKNIAKMYLYYSLRTPFYHRYIKPFASGTTVKHLKLIGVEDYKLSIPPVELQAKFDEIIMSGKRRQMRIINEIRDLEKQRNELLPLLMNGQVSVN